MAAETSRHSPAGEGASVPAAGETGRLHRASNACGRLLRRLWRKRAVLLAGTLAGSLIGAGVLGVIPPRYTASTRLLLETGSTRADAGQLRGRLQVMGSRDLARQVVRELRLGERPGFGGSEEAALEIVLGGLDIHPVDGSYLIAVDYAASGPRLAAEIANAFADTYLLRQQASLDALSDRGTAAPGGQVRLVARADPAVAPRYPRPAVLLIGSGLSGLVVSLAVVLLRGRRRVEPSRGEPAFAPDPMQLRSERRALRHLPWIGAGSERPAARPASQSEAAAWSSVSAPSCVGDLARMLERRGDDARLVLVTGVVADGATGACALRLARDLAAERRVALVSLDTGALGLDQLVPDPRAPGLTDLLFGVASFSEVVQRESASRCHVIPLGRGVREATTLVDADRLTLILGTLAQTYDHVVVAAPPIGHAEGAARLAALRPTVVLVMAEDTAESDAETHAVEAFDALAARGFGAIALVAFPAPPGLPLAA
ncbi:Wzz/FepE/Etk N-terminal domain-containing protein [Ancylobacter sp. 6x-1]|uniref:Wzz/FepE/Etk N-terminal domain-containing protein n=1 Tax=Ancylobacter crimeensis TaxID=2579147 RepID=A0ABT0DDD9_9HYPH|nr:Wzz/FepE/Etk N-terminal domain-containing protein [Ancylobacter crimeensis]MCK0197762.1 Wzz/FepE/Etk N-terminal domain-containing protein [Ancylobacter crimeensis]